MADVCKSTCELLGLAAPCDAVVTSTVLQLPSLVVARTDYSTSRELMEILNQMAATLGPLMVPFLDPNPQGMMSR